jgi:hypothetical protein
VLLARERRTSKVDQGVIEHLEGCRFTRATRLAIHSRSLTPESCLVGIEMLSSFRVLVRRYFEHLLGCISA